MVNEASLPIRNSHLGVPSPPVLPHGVCSAVARPRTSVHPGCPTPPPQSVSTSDIGRAERLDSADCQVSMEVEIICGWKGNRENHPMPEDRGRAEERGSRWERYQQVITPYFALVSTLSESLCKLNGSLTNPSSEVKMACRWPLSYPFLPGLFPRHGWSFLPANINQAENYPALWQHNPRQADYSIELSISCSVHAHNEMGDWYAQSNTTPDE